MIIITPRNWYCENAQFSNRMTGHSPASTVPGYSIIRRDRSNAGKVRGGGVAIYFTSELSTCTFSITYRCCAHHKQGVNL